MDRETDRQTRSSQYFAPRPGRQTKSGANKYPVTETNLKYKPITGDDDDTVPLGEYEVLH